MNWLKFGTYALIAIVSFVIGVLWQDIPYVSLVRSVRLGELINSLVLISATFLIPFAVKRILERKKFVSELLIGDVKDIIDTIGGIMDLVNECCIEATTSPENKRTINFLTKEVDMKISLLESQVEKIFKNDKGLTEQMATVKTKSADFWSSLTGGELMNDDFNIGISYQSAQSPRFIEMKKSLFDLIILVDQKS